MIAALPKSPCWSARRGGWSSCFTWLLLAGSCGLASAADFVPAPGQFPPEGAGAYLAGELIYIDPVNRRGGMRLEGNDKNRYNNGPLHYFALAPYAPVWHNGALAEIRDLPIGTHVHGYFLPPPVGEEDVIPPLPEEDQKFAIPQNYAISLEDDFSFYQRRGQSWKVVSLDTELEKLSVEPAGKRTTDGINTPYVFDIDPVARVWKDRRLSELADIKPGAIVQLNLTWCQGWGDREYGVAEIWLDEESRRFATEMQQRKHVRYQRQRWAPAWIDAVEPNDFGGGIVTLTLFTVDQEILDDFRREQHDRIAVATAENTLRTWFHRADRKFCKLVQWKEIENPPTGSSGIQLKLKFEELLNGYRPGACVRVKCDSWKFVTMPPEERITSDADQERSRKLGFP
ncbi:hypothetical protein [Lignipirellula cremea]|uniref:Uncharacterized protein n=1 Tax=Lignipirellula cremea TaxID=2528010 RepID=A0A518DM50_9BACT|nr:hypothetical protein [Lignipirellula cremea]QDU92920.1 hypothetical protein Pla8534_06930 [Lignipirellula cremea]